jgi:PTH2 family peptidyl-tRNA hydrolase
VIKQVIVWRKDLKVRKGKFAVQVAHASMMFLLDAYRETIKEPHWERDISNCLSSDAEDWLVGNHTKIVVGCDTEADLLDLKMKAIKAQILVRQVTDLGFTEFNGIPTLTCICLGPNKAEDIDKITGHLELM